MGLVNCWNQLGLHIICVQETRSPLIGTLPIDQPFRHDAPVGTQGRAACFSFHSSVDCVSRLKDCRSTVHPFPTGAICVCSFYAPHAGIAISARVQFWRACGLCTSCHAVPLPFVPGRRLQHLVSALPTFTCGQSSRRCQSQRLVLRNPLDFPTHWCALEIILTSNSLTCQMFPRPSF